MTGASAGDVHLDQFASDFHRLAPRVTEVRFSVSPHRDFRGLASLVVLHPRMRENFLNGGSGFCIGV